MGRTRWGVMGTLPRNSPYSNSGSRGCHVRRLTSPASYGLHTLPSPLGPIRIDKSLGSAAAGGRLFASRPRRRKPGVTRLSIAPGHCNKNTPCRCLCCYQLCSTDEVFRRLTQSSPRTRPRRSPGQRFPRLKRTHSTFVVRSYIHGRSLYAH